MANADNILNSNEKISDEQLLKYLSNSLTNDERHAVEMQMADSEFVNDAIEGLQNFTNPQDIEIYTEQLKRQIAKQTSRKKIRIKKRKYKQQDWIVISVIIVVILCVLGYAAVKEFEKQKQKSLQNQQQEK